MAFAEFAVARYAEGVTWARKPIERHPGHLPPYFVLIAAAGLQGETCAATEVMTDLLRLRPDFSLTWAGKNLPLTADIRKRLLDGLRRAGVPET